jgi:phosphotriesterase-related protein
MAQLRTTLGPKNADELGMILPHEHIFVDLRTWDKPGYGEAEVADVIALMAPEIKKIQALGVTALVECSPMGVGRRADLDKAVSAATGLPVVVPTGVYREPWILPWMHQASEDALYEWMLGELEGEIENSGVQAGWIKLSAGDDGITETEAKILRAAARAGAKTNAIIGSHTIRGRVVRDQLDIIESAGYTPERFIWIHTQAEPDFDLHLEMAKRGAWIEYDNIGSDNNNDDWYLDHIQRVLDAGFGDQLMLSHDRGWYDPAAQPGAIPMPYTVLSERLIPKMREHSMDVEQLTRKNPFRAFAR